MAQKGIKICCSEMIMESALARAVALTPPQASPAILVSPTFKKDFEGLDGLERQIKRIMNECSDTELVLRALLQYGPAGKSIRYIQEMCRVRPGIPVLPMITAPCDDEQEVRCRINGDITCEYKYDGMRAQIHILRNGTVKIFSRNNEEITEMYPDLVALMKENLGLEDCIVDCEVAAVNTKTGKVLPFQALQHRKNINKWLSEVNISVCVFLVDLLYLNGKSTLHEDLSRRRELLSAHIPTIPMRRQLVNYKNINADEAIMPLLKEAARAGCKSLIVKALWTQYNPGKLAFDWFELKKDLILEKKRIENSLNLVPIGAKYGTVGIT
jgi:DNA ligase-1